MRCCDKIRKSDKFILSEPATENKLITLPNFIATPHIGAQTKEAQLLAANIIAEKIIQVLRGVL